MTRAAKCVQRLDAVTKLCQTWKTSLEQFVVYQLASTVGFVIVCCR
jgi:hypothetical protein